MTHNYSLHKHKIALYSLLFYSQEIKVSEEITFSKRAEIALAIEPIDVIHYRAYYEKHGPEKAQGYLDALIHFTKNIEALYYYYDPKAECYLGNSASQLRKKLDEFKYRTNEMISEISENGSINRVADVQSPIL